eukprot:CAMPEP_0172323496 /NCGR_PEP_ID=MMETSP1058-20130122/48875_1 /TAXON_ID=83371 /ORGANISM="Detonula confervacea, Strain CCMP 353" /LENGTH=950 /DNA_ID=CAMNT_0013039505 /DNA_START=46 /DNA_END=2895 /DNA_ORIENTATION=+
MRRWCSQLASQRGRWRRKSVASIQRGCVNVSCPQPGTGIFPTFENSSSLLGQEGAIKRNSLPHLTDADVCRLVRTFSITPERTHTIEGIVKKVRHQKPSKFQCTNRFWGIFVIRDAKIDGERKGGMKELVVGAVPEELVEGEVVRFETGELSIHPDHGPQYQIKSVETNRSSTGNLVKCQDQQFACEKSTSMKDYLMEIPNVGPTIADLICDHFGKEEAFNIFANEVLKDGTGLLKRLEEIKELSNTNARSIVQYLREHRHKPLQKLLLFPVQYRIFISKKLCVRIVTMFGFDEKMMKEDPYLLMKVEGMSFNQVDKIGIGMGFAQDSIERFRACVIDAMAPNDDKHTALLHGDFLRAMTDNKGKYKYNEHRVCELLPQLIKDQDLFRTEHNSNVYIQHSSYYKKECGIAERIDKIIGSGSSLPHIRVDEEIEKALAASAYLKFSEKQKDAITHALSHKVSVLTGGPGTGKTMILGALVDILKGMGAVVKQAAPTGKAAQRLEEATNHEARTIHSLIHAIKAPTIDMLDHEEDYQPADYQLEEIHFVIVDEASMMDTDLLSSLLSKIPDECHVLIVGDSDQLPSIGPGQVLEDLIACGKINVTELTEIHRQEKGSDIVRYAHAIKNQKKMESKYLQDINDLDLSTKDDVHFVEVPKTKDVPTKVSGIVRTIKETIGLSDDFNECQILTPTNDVKTDINNLFQELNFNPMVMQLKTSNKVFKINDKVVQTKNIYPKGVFNGMIGKIVDNTESAGCELEEDDKNEDKEVDISVAFDIGGVKPKIVRYNKVDAEDLDLAYATTVHKAQGSDFSVVVIALPEHVYDKLLTRKWIYTAITRGKHKVIVVGNTKTYFKAVLNTYDQKRTTVLRGFLEKRLPNLNRVKAVVHKWIWTQGIERGYGFARSNTNEEFFVHSSNINHDLDLTVGESVIEFDVKANDKPEKLNDAVNVDII